MKSAVLSSSIEAHHSDRVGFMSLSEQILAYSLKHKRFTCHMVAKELKRFPSTVSGVLKPMLECGQLNRELSKHPCEVTGNNVHWIYNPDFSKHLKVTMKPCI